jgi:hypothetical protein
MRKNLNRLLACEKRDGRQPQKGAQEIREGSRTAAGLPRPLERPA